MLYSFQHQKLHQENIVHEDSLQVENLPNKTIAFQVVIEKQRSERKECIFFNLVKNWGPDKGEKSLRKNGEEINKRKPAECTEVLPAVLSYDTEKWSVLTYPLNHYSSREICDKNISIA